MNTRMFRLLPLLLALLAPGCASTGPKPPPVLAPRVEVPRFMGDWYVLASIPLWPERDAYNGVESYRLEADGRIRTTYTFRKGGFDGPLKTYRPVATVYNRATGAEWRMQFLWPFQAAFLIHHVADDYSTTIIGEPGLKHVWIMARTPQIPEETYRDLVERAATVGYDVSRLRRVPQRWE
jgi:apolipoprotein D and lipocalin family protein